MLIAEQKGHIVRWASLSRWSNRCAYSGTAEVLLYVREEFRGIGIGRQLIEEGKNRGLHTVIARVAGDNGVSMRLFELAGFQRIGVMREVGRKFGKLLDVYLLQKIFES